MRAMVDRDEFFRIRTATAGWSWPSVTERLAAADRADELWPALLELWGDL